MLYSNSQAEIVINESNIDDLFESSYNVIISKIQNHLGKGSSWIINSVVDLIISISSTGPYLVAIIWNYQKNETIPKRVWLIFKTSVIMLKMMFGQVFTFCRSSSRMNWLTKIGFKDKKIAVKVKKSNCICISVFGYENIKKSIYVSKMSWRKTLSLIWMIYHW